MALELEEETLDHLLWKRLWTYKTVNDVCMNELMRTVCVEDLVIEKY
jgi:hypothetical protein